MYEAEVGFGVLLSLWCWEDLKVRIGKAPCLLPHIESTL